MENHNYLDELAQYYPTLAQKRSIAITIITPPDTFTITARPHHNGTFIDVEFMQQDKFCGYRAVSLLELEPLWRQQNADND